MRELTVYYCPKCGFYGYYQLPQNAVCPHCRSSMTELRMAFKNFMRLEYEARDKLIADQIAGEVIPYSSVVQRLTEPEKSCRRRLTASELKGSYEKLEEENREQAVLIEKLRRDNRELQEKNQENEDTIRWMHDMIWDLTRRLHEMK